MNDLQSLFNWSIIGHQTAINYLQNSLLNNKLTHAYLFWGPKYIGKKSLAKKFSQSINCENLRLNPVPCNKCQNCQQFTKNIFPDFYEINLALDKQDIIIEQIKNLQSQLKLKSLLRNYKIAIINDADKLNQVSANALLKTLEEPFAKTIIILIAEDLNKIIPTIISRCQIIKFNYLVDQDIYNHLLEKNYKRSEINFLVKLIHGQIGLIFQEDFADYLKNYDKHLNNLLKFFSFKDYQKIKFLEQILKNQEREATDEMINIWQSLIRDFFLYKNGNYDKIVNQKYLANFKIIETKYSLAKIVNLLKIISQLPLKLRLNINPKLILENLILNL